MCVELLSCLDVICPRMLYNLFSRVKLSTGSSFEIECNAKFLISVLAVKLW